MRGVEINADEISPESCDVTTHASEVLSTTVSDELFNNFPSFDKKKNDAGYDCTIPKTEKIKIIQSTSGGTIVNSKHMQTISNDLRKNQW